MPTSPADLASLRAQMARIAAALQDEVCAAIERIDGHARFTTDR